MLFFFFFIEFKSNCVFGFVCLCVCSFEWYATIGYLLSLFFVTILGMILNAINILVSLFAPRHWTCKWLFIRCTVTRGARVSKINGKIERERSEFKCEIICESKNCVDIFVVSFVLNINIVANNTNRLKKNYFHLVVVK